MKHPVYDTDKHFTIDLTTSALVSQMKKISLVKGSHNAERFTFDFPLTVEGHDLSLCDTAEVHFLNIDDKTKETSKGTYKIDDIEVSEDGSQVIFSWLIDGRATKFRGIMTFSIHFKCMEDGKLLYRFPTAVFSGIQISDGLDHSEEVMGEYTDIVAAWMNEIEQSISDTIREAVDSNIGDTVSEAVDKVVAETVGGAVDKAIEDALEGSVLTSDNLSNAVKGYASGAEIILDDLSPFASTVTVGVAGKQPPEVPMMMSMRSATSEELVNLIPFVREDGELGYKDLTAGVETTIGGVTFYVNNDGSITAVGNANASPVIVLYEGDTNDNNSIFKVGTHYTAYQNKVGDLKMFIVTYNEEGKTSTIVSGNNSTLMSNKISDDAITIKIYLLFSANANFTEGVTFYPMIVEGEKETITQYVSPQGATADGGSHTHIDANHDHLCDECGEQITACVDNDKDHKCDICGTDMGAHEDANHDHLCDYCGEGGFGEHRDADGDGLCDYCHQPIDEVITPLSVKVQTASVDDPDTIVETVVTVAGAIVEVAPIFPAMIIKTDSEEVLLSAEYNKDTNAVIAELREAIQEGGNVGDIDTALDAIISIQESLIGGASE